MGYLLAIVAAAFLLRHALVFRAMAARVFRTAQARLLPAGTVPPAAVADLYERADAELRALGFEQPVWVLTTFQPAEGSAPTLYAVYRHPGETGLAWLSPTTDLRAPNQLQVRFTTRLADARTLTSQVFDPYFELVATPEAPAQTIQGRGLAEQWSRHQLWRASFGIAADAQSLHEQDILSQAGERYNEQIERLVALGRLWRGADGEARASLGFALKAVLLFRRRPAPPANKDPVPAARMALLASTVERARAAVAPARVQWLMFAVSLALFLILGSLAWSADAALMLFGVIAFHEAGHYLAMRAFGYRNVQVMMLPLVGGVTIGHESEPNAARRAWMSLMGPLPGIVLGWVLFIAPALLHIGEGWSGLNRAALMLLGINYLNILPVPPLDGGRVVQALLPPRWMGAQALFIGAACVVGAIGAFGLGVPYLAVLAVSSLMGIPLIWQNGKVVRALLPVAAESREQLRGAKLRKIFEAFEALGMPVKKVPVRIAQAESVLQAVDMPPMRLGQRIALTTTFGFLLLVPAAAVVFFLLLQPMERHRGGATAGQEYASIHQRQLEAAQAMTLAQLVADLGAESASAASHGASEAEVAAAESRLQARLPEDVRALYLIADGLPELGVRPLAMLQRPDAALMKSFGESGTDGRLLLYTPGPQSGKASATVATEVLANTIRIGGDDDEDDGVSALLLDLNRPPVAAGSELLEFSAGVLLRRGNMRAWLAERWADQAAMREIRKRRDQQVARARAALAGADVDALSAKLRHPNLVSQLLLHLPAWPGPAADDEIQQAQGRLAVSLPADYRAFLARHDGLAQLGLLPVAEIERLSKLPGQQKPKEPAAQPFSAPSAAADAPALKLEAEDLENCIRIGALGGGKVPLARSVPTLLWCPQLERRGAALIDLRGRSVYPDFTGWLRDQVARQMASQFADQK